MSCSGAAYNRGMVARKGWSSFSAAAGAVVAFAVFTAFMFVPLWFVLGFVAVSVSGTVQKWQIWVAAPVALGFGGWVASLAYGYFRGGEEERP